MRWRWAWVTAGILMGFGAAVIVVLPPRTSTVVVFTICGAPTLVSITAGPHHLEFDPDRATTDQILAADVLVRGTEFSVRRVELVEPRARLWEQLGPCEVDEDVFTHTSASGA